MKIKLNLNERLLFLNLLPKENNFATLKIVRTVMKEVGIADGEFKEFGILPADDGRINWGTNKDPKKREEELKKAEKEKEFEIGQVAEALIVSALKKLDEEKKLLLSHNSLYEKFVKE